MEPNSVEFRTEAPQRETLLSPELEYDVSVIGIFLGGVLGIALLLNNFRRGTTVMTTMQASFSTVVAAARSISTTAFVVAPPKRHESTTTSTSTADVTYVFQPTDSK